MENSNKINISLSDIRSEIYNNFHKSCDNCKYFKNISIADGKFRWCFKKRINGIIEKPERGLTCAYYIKQKNPTELLPDLFRRNERKIRNDKIRRLSYMFRFSFSIIDNIAYITSRYDHWLIVPSNGEKLYHKSRDIRENSPQIYHLQKASNKDPYTLLQLFFYIDAHDSYTLRCRLLRGVKLENSFSENDFELDNDLNKDI